MGLYQENATVIYEDNAAAIEMANTQKPTKRTRHVDIKYFALNIDSAGGYEETLKNDFFIRGAVRFALDPSGPQFHYTRV